MEDSLLDDDDPLKGHSDHAPSDGEGEGDQEMSSADEFSDGGDNGEKGKPMEVGAPADKETVAPSTSNNTTTSTTPMVIASDLVATVPALVQATRGTLTLPLPWPMP